MKKFFRKIVLALLKFMAKKRMKKFKGKIIAVTGSVGKTSTKDAIFCVLNRQFKVKRSKKSLNTEFGLLLTILDIDTGYSSFVKWFWLLLKAFLHSLTKDYSEILLLEFGVDKPGDMNFLLSIAKPDIAIFTNVFPVHLEENQFSDIQDIFKEKRKLIDSLENKGTAILNIDNDLIKILTKSRNKNKTFTYGSSKEADFWASQIKTSLEGTSFILHHDMKRYDVLLPVLGKFQASVTLPAIICGHLMEIPIELCIEALSSFSLPPGRMNIISGLEESIILDSSYNSSPFALKKALFLLKELGEKKRKVAVLGDMNELGEKSQYLHEKIGEIIPDCVDILLTVGSCAKIIAKKAEEKGLSPKNIFTFNSAKAASDFFKENIKKNDLILVKGSQNNVRLENFIKNLMTEPEKAKELLVRQEKFWKKG